MSPTGVPAGFDHLMFGGGLPLDALVEDFARRSGVTATIGGRHATGGTHNALLALGASGYLELIAADPEGDPKAQRRRLIAGLARPCNIAWAIVVRDLDATLAQARQAGYDPGPAESLERLRPDGQRLSWRLAWRSPEIFLGVVPFLIDWQDCEHPARSTPAGCTLVELRAEHPEPDRVRTILNALDVAMSLSQGPQPALIATLDTPRGPVILR